MHWPSRDIDPLERVEAAAPVRVPASGLAIPEGGVCDRQAMAAAILRIALSAQAEASPWAGQVSSVLLSGWNAVDDECER